MTIELLLLLAAGIFVILSPLSGKKGPRGAFEAAKGKLGARMEASMTTGVCYRVPKGGGTPCQSDIQWYKHSDY